MVIDIVLQFSQTSEIYFSCCINLSVSHSYVILFSLVFLIRCVSRVNEEWFADEQRVRERVGLLEKPENHETPSPGQSQEDCEVYISHKVHRLISMIFFTVVCFLVYRQMIGR